MRFSCFETLTLPIMRAQSDPKFTFAILIRENPLCLTKDRLCPITADVPQIKIIKRTSFPYRQVAYEVMNSLKYSRATNFVEFRLDDEDTIKAACSAL